MIFESIRHELSPRQAAELENALFLDVREPQEWERVRLPGSLHVPLALLPEHAGELPPDRPIVVVCHHGMRSQRAAHFLRKLGFREVYNLIGGIDRWALEMDPSLPRY